jgi:hypothetical protein
MSDPTDDKTYAGLSLKDFITHFAPQEAKQREEVNKINSSRFCPLADPNFPETLRTPEKKGNRSARRQQELKERKEKGKK